MTEVFFRNPHNYIKELVEVPTARNVIWDRGMLVKRSIDPVSHASLYFSGDLWRVWVCGEQGTAELDPEHSMHAPAAVYPTWVYGVDDLADLEEMILNPLGEDQAACETPNVSPDERPVFGQEHRVIITDVPPVTQGATKHLFRNIQEIIEDYGREVKLHLHGSYSYAGIFGKFFASGDIDPRTTAAHGDVYLPNGKRISAAQAVKVPHWINMLDMTATELKQPRNRCIFNIKSALWAGHNYERDINFQTTRTALAIDPRAKEIQSVKGGKRVLGKKEAQPGDKVVCNSCSLSDGCKYYRDGAVCSLPESESSPLVQYFKSRDADKIIDALGTVVGAQAARVERAVEEEDEYGEINPEVNKMLNSLFANGLKLAKVINPNLMKPGVQINFGGQVGNAGVSPNQLVAQAMRALEDQGIARDEITPEMVEGMILQMTGMERKEPVTVQGELSA